MLLEQRRMENNEQTKVLNYSMSRGGELECSPGVCSHQSRLEPVSMTVVHIVFKLKWGFFVQCRGTRGRTFLNITSTVNTVQYTLTMVGKQ